MERFKKRSDIQGLRALAVISVVAYHAGLPITGGFIGVDIFFVISGYVITQMLIKEWTISGNLNLIEFYFRRFKRLVPALATVISFTLTFGFLFISPFLHDVAWQTGLASLLLSSNIIIAWKTGGYFDPDASRNPLLNTWSLGVEEQFYIFFPFLLLFILKNSKIYSGIRKRLIFVLVLCGSISIFFILIEKYLSPFSKMISMALGFYSPITRAWEFIAGALLFILLKDITISKLISIISGIAGLAMVLAGLFFVSGDVSWPNFLTVLPVIGCMLLIISGSNIDSKNFISLILTNKKFVYLGDISYSLYLWHWPLIVIAGINFGANYVVCTIASIFSLLPAILTYKYIENPIRKMPLMATYQNFILILFVLLIPFLVVVISECAYRYDYWSSKIHNFKEYVVPLHRSNASGCGQGYVPISVKDKKCTWNIELTGKPIYLMGDSNADHVSESVIASSFKLGSPVQIVTKGGCSFLGRSWSDRNDFEATKCINFVDQSMNLFTSSPPGLVVIGLSDSIWRELGTISVGSSRSTESKDQSVAFNYLLDDYVNKISLLKKAGHKVLLLLPVPKFVNSENKILFDFSLCSVIDVAAGICPKEIFTTLEYQLKLQSQARLAIQSAANLTNSDTLDLLQFLCKNNRCFNIEGDKFLYRDAGHLSVKFSEDISNIFYDKFNQIYLQSK